MSRTPEQLRTAVYTLGCKVNYFESEALKAQFCRYGFRVVENEEKADVCVINSYGYPSGSSKIQTTDSQT